MFRIRKLRTAAIVDMPWDGNVKTSATNPNYMAEAPEAFYLSPKNEWGKLLYEVLGHRNVLTINTIEPQADGVEVKWLASTLSDLPFQVLLICSATAQAIYEKILGVHPFHLKSYRTVYLPAPSDKWDDKALEAAGRFLQQGTSDLHLQFRGGRLRAKQLPPF